MSRNLDLEDPICNIAAIALLINRTIDNATSLTCQEDVRKDYRSALYWLVGQLGEQAEDLKEKFYAD